MIPPPTERLRRDLLALVDRAVPRFGPADAAAARALIAGDVLALARPLAPADLDRLTLRELTDLFALLSAATAPAPTPPPDPRPGTPTPPPPHA